MGKWGEVTRRTHRAPGWDDGKDVSIEHLEDSLHHHRSDPGVALGEGPGPEQEDRPHQRIGQGSPDARGMRTNEVVLEGLGLVSIDPGRGESAESGGDPVDDFA